MTDKHIWEERREAWQARADDVRTAFEVDYARILHSPSFRRLAGKTQVISSGDGDHARTRLTHSLEVSQIALGIAQRFRLMKDLPDVLRTHVEDNSLIQTIGLVHDLGHPPFGHAGEQTLQVCMRDHGGFEGNGHTLRILSKLEDFSASAGANLTRRTLLGTLKYPVPYSQALTRKVPGPIITEAGVALIKGELHSPPKCYLDTETDVVDWLLAPLSDADRNLVVSQRAKTVDCQLMDLADDLAYSIADMQDAIALGMITRDQLSEDVPEALWLDYVDYGARRGGSDGDADSFASIMDSLFGDRRALQRQIGCLMGWGMARIRISERNAFQDPLYASSIDLEAPARALVEALKKSILERVILSPRVQHGRQMGQRQILWVMDVLMNDPRHQLPEKRYAAYRESGCDPRIICDWIAGSTEGFLRKLYERMFVPGAASVLDRL